MQLANDQYLTEGTLTTFTGIPFSSKHPYNPLEAKRVLKLLMNNLRQHKELESELGLNLSHGGRAGIAAASLVWDFIPTKRLQDGNDFTRFPHYGIAITDTHTLAVVTIPNGVDPVIKKKIKELCLEGFRAAVKTIASNVETVFASQAGCIPFIDLVQRRYPSQRSIAIDDARIQFDIRTAFEDLDGNENQVIKTQSEWLDASYQALVAKKSNLQLAIGVKFAHDRCSAIHTPEAENLCVQAWLACKEFTSKILG